MQGRAQRHRDARDEVYTPGPPNIRSFPPSPFIVLSFSREGRGTQAGDARRVSIQAARRWPQEGRGNREGMVASRVCRQTRPPVSVPPCGFDEAAPAGCLASRAAVQPACDLLAAKNTRPQPPYAPPRRRPCCRCRLPQTWCHCLGRGEACVCVCMCVFVCVLGG